MRQTRQVLTALSAQSKIDSVLLTHTHSDHISYYPLRVLEELGLAIHLHSDCADQLRDIHFNDYGFPKLKLVPFQRKKFVVGDFCIQPFEVVHNPDFPTFGYQIDYQGKKILIVTDFARWEDLIDYFLDADFIFVESNHDLGLLALYFNPNSRFHMSNPDTAKLLVNARRGSRKAPVSVMLGHLSSQRNNAHLALQEIQNAFRNADIELDFHLQTAPLKEASQAILLM
ncbi:MAG: hypothetical protein KBI46_03610 [Phycisphaerae bacterium]|nr:hypothetical protein [Phycisphaerae bacterium]